MLWTQLGSLMKTELEWTILLAILHVTLEVNLGGNKPAQAWEAEPEDPSDSQVVTASLSI